MTMNKMALEDNALDQVSGGSFIPYAVTAQDTLQSIAAANHCSVEQLMAWNGIKNPNAIAADQVLKIKF